MIGDARGKGLAAIGEAALLLGAFREAAHQNTTLPAPAGALEKSISRYLADFEPEEAGERFVTALLMEFPEGDPATRMTDCGHLAPLLLSPGHGTFCSFAERAAGWTDNTPESLLHHLRRDLLARTGGRLDDAALIAIRRMPTRHAGRHHVKPVLRASEPRSWNQM
ncbi:SpoIIE family protein phosphatase [Streptomyces mirabilis]